MRNRLIIIALCFSLALNIAVIGTLVYFWSQPQKPHFRSRTPREREFPGMEFGLDDQQHAKARDEIQQYKENIGGVMDSLRMCRKTLMELLVNDSNNQVGINTTIEKIAKYQIEIEKITINHLLKMRDILTPEQWYNLVNAIEMRMPHHAGRFPPEGPPDNMHRRFNRMDSTHSDNMHR